MKQTVMSDKALKISYLLLPFLILSAGLIHQGHHNTIIIIGLFLVASMIKNIWIRGLMYYVCIWNTFLGFVFLMGDTNRFTFSTAIGFGFYMMIASIILIAVYYSKMKNESFYNMICIMAIFQSLFAVMQLWGIDPIFWLYGNIVEIKRGMEATVIVGTLGNNNFLSLFLAISLPFFFRKMWWYFVPVIIVLMFIAITSTSMVAMVIGCLYYFWPKVKKRYLVLMTLPFLVFTVITKQSLTIHLLSSSHDRFDFWLVAWNQISQTWQGLLLGIGPGAPWGSNFPLHNEWITLFWHFGIIGSVLAVGYLITIYRKNRMLLSAFIIACIGAMGTYPMHLAPSAFLILIIIGLIEREKHNAHKKCGDRFVCGSNPCGFTGTCPGQITSGSRELRPILKGPYEAGIK